MTELADIPAVAEMAAQGRRFVLWYEVGAGRQAD